MKYLYYDGEYADKSVYRKSIKKETEHFFILENGDRVNKKRMILRKSAWDGYSMSPVFSIHNDGTCILHIDHAKPSIHQNYQATHIGTRNQAIDELLELNPNCISEDV